MNKGTLLPCFTSNEWSSNQNESYIDITIHLINEGCNLVSYEISLLHTEWRHTSENLREDLESVMDE